MDQQMRNHRIAAVKAADAINAIGGVPVSDYARNLFDRWARGEITGEEMKSVLLSYYQKVAAEVQQSRP